MLLFMFRFTICSLIITFQENAKNVVDTDDPFEIFESVSRYLVHFIGDFG